MITSLQRVLERALELLSSLIATYLPALLAGLAILLVAWVTAVLARWLLTRIFRGVAVDRFLRQSGIASLLSRSGRLRATPLVAAAIYWAILLIGLLTALSAFDSRLTSRIIEGIVLLFPKLLTAAAILVAGLWLAQYLGRSTLVWAFNEGLPGPRRLAAAVRVVIVLAALAIAADQLDFGRNVLLAAFVLLAGGVVLVASLALGLGGREAVRRCFEDRESPSQQGGERSLWDHL
jgi:hypothetical protein